MLCWYFRGIHTSIVSADARWVGPMKGLGRPGCVNHATPPHPPFPVSVSKPCWHMSERTGRSANHRETSSSVCPKITHTTDERVPLWSLFLAYPVLLDRKGYTSYGRNLTSSRTWSDLSLSSSPAARPDDGRAPGPLTPPTPTRSWWWRRPPCPPPQPLLPPPAVSPRGGDGDDDEAPCCCCCC